MLYCRIDAWQCQLLPGRAKIMSRPLLFGVSVRHEARVVRMEMRELHHGLLRSEGWEPGRLSWVTTGIDQSGLTKPWRVARQMTCARPDLLKSGVR
ncbi:hypothetical protein LAUMK136_04230 [Mycobacterium attenuatum]|uniref:Uncharacterized protein n=1 Tax=Mycobacterium attenuatum TaxID=2341086 RepID=A0A498Q7Z3_9MYCO|nr:hypothetical protein LAUMK136_04230 [Mycobacterium attenuatum]